MKGGRVRGPGGGGGGLQGGTRGLGNLLISWRTKRRTHAAKEIRGKIRCYVQKFVVTSVLRRAVLWRGGNLKFQATLPKEHKHNPQKR